MKPADDLGAQGRQFWTALTRLKPRDLVLYALAYGVVHGALHVLMFSGGAVASFGRGLGLTIGMLLGGLVAASVGASIGWLVRGEFSVRPMFSTVLLTTCVTGFCLDFLRPLSIQPTVGALFGLIMVVALFTTSAISTFVGLMTVFPHRWTRGLMVTAGILSALGVQRIWKEQIAGGREAFTKAAFAEDSPALARFVEAKGGTLIQDFENVENAIKRQPAGVRHR